jgi:hypothetical protein
VLSLRFAHSFGFVHGHRTGNTMFFNENGVIQITDLARTVLESGPTSENLQRFFQRLGIPLFVSEIIETGESTDLKAVRPLSDMLKILKRHRIQEIVQSISFLCLIKLHELF